MRPPGPRVIFFKPREGLVFRKLAVRLSNSEPEARKKAARCEAQRNAGKTINDKPGHERTGECPGEVLQPLQGRIVASRFRWFLLEPPVHSPFLPIQQTILAEKESTDPPLACAYEIDQFLNLGKNHVRRLEHFNGFADDAFFAVKDAMGRFDPRDRLV